MFEKRIQDWSNSPIEPSSTNSVQPAFVAWPIPTFASGAAHQAFIAEVYRKAQELAEAQLRQPKKSWRQPEFSLN